MHRDRAESTSRRSCAPASPRWPTDQPLTCDGLRDDEGNVSRVAAVLMTLAVMGMVITLAFGMWMIHYAQPPG